jgi:hypothetical protein
LAARFLFTLFLSLLIALSFSTSATVSARECEPQQSLLIMVLLMSMFGSAQPELLAFPSSVLFFCALHQPLLGCRVLHVTSVDEIFITALQNLLLVSHPVTT